RGVRDGVGGVIAAGEVVVERCAELDHRMPSVGVDVATEGGDFVHDVVLIQHTDRSELDADRHRSFEKLADLVRRGAGRQIPVEMWMAEQGVAHGSANAPGFESCVLEALRDAAYSLGR